jgi:hypothetical protein
MTNEVKETTKDKSTVDLLMEVADDARLLIRKEIELARIELMAGLRAQIVGAALIALALLGVLPALLFGLVALALSLPFSNEISFAIVTGGLFLFAVVGVLIGWRIMRRRPVSLKQTTKSIKEDVEWARQQLKS